LRRAPSCGWRRRHGNEIGLCDGTAGARHRLRARRSPRERHHLRFHRDRPGRRERRGIVRGRPVRLAGYSLADRTVALDTKVDSRNGAPPGDGCPVLPTQAGEWEYIPGSRMRIRAIAHHHAAQVLGIWHLWPGCLDADRTAPPTRASDWLEGPIFAYVIDFLAADGRTPVWRVYYQDSPVDGPSGMVPEEILAERNVDLAFLGVGNYDRTEKPEAIIAAAKPAHVILHHWENFLLGDPRRSLRQLPLHDGAAYQRTIRAELDRLGGERTLDIMAPDVRLRFEP